MREFCFEIALHTAWFNLKFNNFQEKHRNQFDIIFFAYFSRFVSSKDRGLHFYMNDIQDRNVNLPMDSKCKHFALESLCTLLDSI